MTAKIMIERSRPKNDDSLVALDLLIQPKRRRLFIHNLALIIKLANKFSFYYETKAHHLY